MPHEIIFFLTGIVIGSMNAIAGGGMLVGFPILLAYGYPALTISATTGAIVLPGNISAVLGYKKYLKRIPKSYILLVIPSVIGAAIGSTALRHTSYTDFEHYIPWLILLAVILFTFQPYIYKQMHDHIHSSRKRDLQSLGIFGVSILILSIYGGYFGAGFGFVMLAFLGFTKLHNHIHRMNALKNLITVCIATTSIICLYSSNLIDWRLALIMGLGNLIGGYFSAVWIQRVSANILRVIIIIIGFSTAIYLGLRSY